MTSRLFEAKPYVIAEVGSNWRDFQDAKESVSAAKQCKADAVKFQLFDSFALYGRDDVPVKGGIPREWVPLLAEKAKACGIDFMVSAFSEELVDLADPYVSAFKVASSDSGHVPLLRHLNKKGKPVILSVGATSRSDISLACETLEDVPTVLLYCNAAYPSYGHNLFHMEDLKRFGKPIGLSDHSLDWVYAPLSAVKHFGAVVIEKHFRLEHITDTPDVPHSVTPEQFSYMTDHLRGHRGKAFGSPEEKDFALQHNRRAMTTRPIKAGERLKYGENFGFYRSLTPDRKGLGGFVFARLNGSMVVRDLLLSEPIGPDDIEA